MNGVVYRPIGPVEDALVVLDATRRAYAGVSRDGAYWHLIQPARLGDPRVADGIRQVGQLVCTCRGGTFHGTCYRIEEAERVEAGTKDTLDQLAELGIGFGDPVEDSGSWFTPRLGLDDGYGAGGAVEASRG